jgi:hypothetical protein
VVNTVHWLFEARKSPEFQALMQLVAETEVDGIAKFTPRVCRELGRMLVCRSYAPALLELCHLIVIAQACGPRRADQMERFFWDSGPARPDVIKGYIADKLERAGWRWPGFTATNNDIEIDAGTLRFTVSYARMPLLSALMEFLLSALGYPVVDDVLQVFSDTPPSKKAMSDTANELSRLLYDYLKDHLPTAQAQRKFHRLIDYLIHRLDAGFDQRRIDDRQVLDFWLSASQGDGDFKTFEGVFRDFVHLHRSLALIGQQRAMTSPSTIGSDRDAGDVDPGELDVALEHIDPPLDPLSGLRAPPASEVKFLNKQEQSAIERLSWAGDTACALPLSLLRCEVFEAGRKRLSQALRNRMEQERLQSLISECVESNHAQRIKTYETQAKHLEKTLLASLHVLMDARSEAAIALALALNPELDVSQLSGRATCPSGAGMIDAFFDALIKDGVSTPIVLDSQRAYKSISRAGFRPADAGKPEIIEGFETATPVLLQLRRLLNLFRQTLTRIKPQEEDWTEQFEADRAIFTDQFLRLYGQPDNPQ